MSDDGRHGLTLILMVGSVFSPFYRREIERGRGDPERHAAVNLALYDLARPGGSWLGPLFRRKTGDHWVLTEGARVERDRQSLTIGDTQATWDGRELRVRVREKTAPLASNVTGTLVVRPAAVEDEVHALDAAGKHIWSPIAPFGRIEVDFGEPGLRWTGPAYLDHNAGDEPLARGFRGWTWSRMTSADRTVVIYDVDRLDGSFHRIARSFHAGGARETYTGGVATLPLSTTRFQMARSARAPSGDAAKLGRTLEDTPFYARSHLVGTLDGRPAEGVHEVVDMARFESRVVQHMLPYRMRKVSP